MEAYNRVKQREQIRTQSYNRPSMQKDNYPTYVEEPPYLPDSYYEKKPEYGFHGSSNLAEIEYDIHQTESLKKIDQKVTLLIWMFIIVLVMVVVCCFISTVFGCIGTLLIDKR